MAEITGNSSVWLAVLAFLVAYFISFVVIKWPALFLKTGHMQTDLSAHQSEHINPTPRIGGVAVLLGFSVGMIVTQATLASSLVLALLAGCIVIAIGVREDLVRDMPPRPRLFAALASAALAIALSGAMLSRITVPYMDSIIAITPIAIMLTLFWSAGACHAVNLIDGLNGLSSGYSVFACIGFYFIAGQTGDADIQLVSLILAASLMGFFVWNWPGGRIFMGDAGAYGVGHILAWLGIFLIARNPSVSVMAILLVMFWPVADTAFAIIRRVIRGKSTGEPDRLHSHHLVVRALRMFAKGKFKDEMYNPIASAILWPFMAAPILTGVLFWDTKLGGVVFVLFYSFLFVTTYSLVMEYVRARRHRR